MDDAEEESAAGPEALAAVQASLCPASSFHSLREEPHKHLCWLCYTALATALGVCGTA